MTDAALLAELNRDIWHPFAKSNAALDAPGYLALHHPDLVRIDGGRSAVLDLAGYRAGMIDFMTDMRERGGVLDIGFRFTQRIAAPAGASERGFFRLILAVAGEDERLFLGRFHTIARKRDGVWRLLVDYDEGPAAAPTEAEYAAARHVNDLAAFG